MVLQCAVRGVKSAKINGKQGHTSCSVRMACLVWTLALQRNAQYSCHFKVCHSQAVIKPHSVHSYWNAVSSEMSLSESIAVWIFGDFCKGTCSKFISKGLLSCIAFSHYLCDTLDYQVMNSGLICLFESDLSYRNVDKNKTWLRCF